MTLLPDRMRLPLFVLAAMLGAQAGAAEPIEVAGPAGPLVAEAVSVPDARDVVLIIPGSGPVDRDGNAPAMALHTDSYRLLAEGLAEQGIASVRIDKRGFGGSAEAIADPAEITVDGYRDDTRNWVARAGEIAPCVWIAGHSEGGLVALMAADPRPRQLCGLILMASPGRPVGQLMIEQVGSNPMSAHLVDDLRPIVADLEAGRSRDPETIPPMLRAMFTPGLQRYMIDLFRHDAAVIAQAWKGPALIVQGDRDFQVTTVDADLLSDAMPQAGTLLLEGGTHMLKAEIPGQPLATYADPELPLHPDLVPGITSFIRNHKP